jgi:predicted GNAT family acetyltransferase
MNAGEVWFVRMNEGKRYIVVLDGEPEEVTVTEGEVATSSKAVRAKGYARPQVRLMAKNLIDPKEVKVKAKLEGKGQAKEVTARVFGVEPDSEDFFVPVDLFEKKMADSIEEAEAFMFSEEGAAPMLLPPRTDGYKPEL